MASDDTFTAEVPQIVVEDPQYTEWFESADGTQTTKVEAARYKVESEGLITSAKSLGEGLYEKKWTDGLRLYFAVVKEKDGKKTLLLLGSGKGKDQDKAIKRARKSLESRDVEKSSIKKKD